MRFLALLLLIGAFAGGCASSGRGVRQEAPAVARSAQARPGDAAWEDQVYRAYERRLNAPGNPIQRVGGAPERMSSRTFQRWAARHDRKVTAWERRQAGAVARKFRISAAEVIRVYCAAVTRRFTEGIR